MIKDAIRQLEKDIAKIMKADTVRITRTPDPEVRDALNKYAHLYLRATPTELKYLYAGLRVGILLTTVKHTFGDFNAR